MDQKQKYIHAVMVASAIALSSAAYADTADETATAVAAQSTLRASISQTTRLLKEAAITSPEVGNTSSWVAGSITQVEDDNSASAFDGERTNVLIGASHHIDQNFTLGISVGYEESDIDTEFNRSETANLDGALESDGWLVAPYVSYQFDEVFSAHVAGSYAWLDYDSVRYASGSDARVSGSTDAVRYHVEVGGNALYSFDNWRLKGAISYLYGREEKDNFTESNATVQEEVNTDLSQVRANTELGYQWGVLLPYATAGFDYDLAKSITHVGASQMAPEDNDFGVIIGGGIKLFATPNITGALEGTTVLLRENYREVNASANLRIVF